MMVMSKPTDADRGLAHDMLKDARFIEADSIYRRGRITHRTDWDAATLRKEAAKLLGVEVV